MRRDDESVFASLQRVSGATYDNANYNKDLLDVYLLQKAREKGIRLPTGGPPEEYKYLGAFVETPTAGMNENVLYCDLASLYPSIIMSLNASPETIVGTQSDLDDSPYTEDDCVWGYIDTRPVKHLSKGESWQQYTDGGYKMVYDPHAPEVKWTCDEGSGPRYEKLYFLDHETQKGFLTECVEDLIELKNQYRGTSLYGSTKRVTNCFTDDTNILTPNGPRNITNIEEGDVVWSFSHDDYRVEPTRVEWTADYPAYDEQLYRFCNEEVDLQVTPDHQMVYVTADGELATTSAEALAKELTSRDVVLPSVSNHGDVNGTVLTQDDVERYGTAYGVYCLNVGEDNTVIAGRNGKFQPVQQSIYGVLGFATEDSSFRLFDWRLAEAVTLTGRKIIKGSRDRILDYLADEGYDDAYPCSGDTDATAVSLPTVATKDEAMRVVGNAVKWLNSEGYDDLMAEEFGVSPEYHHTEIEIESFAPRLFIPSEDPPHGEVGSKKRYIQWETWNDDDGETDEISITGLEAVRSDTAPVTQTAQEAFAETIRYDDKQARGEVFPQLRELAESIQQGTIDLDRVCKRGGLGQSLAEYGTQSRRPAPLYRGAKYANDNIEGVTIQRGDKPRVVYVTDVRGDYPSTYSAVTAEDGDRVDAVSLPDASRLPEEFEVDWDAHWVKALKEPMRPLLETRGWSWSEILHGHNQSGLDAYA